jgi:hypothetical protein
VTRKLIVEPDPTPLEPADRVQCQALIPNKTWSPFAFGPADQDPVTGEKRGGSTRACRMWRCRKFPVALIEEVEPDRHGRLGQMTLCEHCFETFLVQGEGHRARIAETLSDEPVWWVDTLGDPPAQEACVVQPVAPSRRSIQA